MICSVICSVIIYFLYFVGVAFILLCLAILIAGSIDREWESWPVLLVIISLALCITMLHWYTTDKKTVWRSWYGRTYNCEIYKDGE